MAEFLEKGGKFGVGGGFVDAFPFTQCHDVHVLGLKLAKRAPGGKLPFAGIPACDYGIGWSVRQARTVETTLVGDVGLERRLLMKVHWDGFPVSAHVVLQYSNSEGRIR